MRAVAQRGLQMREVKVKRTELLEKVSANKVNHIKEYDEARIDYCKASMQEHKIRMMELEKFIGNDSPIDQFCSQLQVPQNHAKDYDQVIQMLEMSIDDVITIRSDEFACYVMDDWDWRSEFAGAMLSNKRYVG